MDTWSNDISLTFCLAESLSNDYYLADLAIKFINWKYNWTATGDVFDLGVTSDSAISDLEEIISNDNLNSLKKIKNQTSEFDNGNDSSMRILPILFHVKVFWNKLN